MFSFFGNESKQELEYSKSIEQELRQKCLDQEIEIKQLKEKVAEQNSQVVELEIVLKEEMEQKEIEQINKLKDQEEIKHLKEKVAEQNSQVVELEIVLKEEMEERDIQLKKEIEKVDELGQKCLDKEVEINGLNERADKLVDDFYDEFEKFKEEIAHLKKENASFKRMEELRLNDNLFDQYQPFHLNMCKLDKVVQKKTLIYFIEFYMEQFGMEQYGMEYIFSKRQDLYENLHKNPLMQFNILKFGLSHICQIIQDPYSHKPLWTKNFDISINTDFNDIKQVLLTKDKFSDNDFVFKFILVKNDSSYIETNSFALSPCLIIDRKPLLKKYSPIIYPYCMSINNIILNTQPLQQSFCKEIKITNGWQVDGWNIA